MKGISLFISLLTIFVAFAQSFMLIPDGRVVGIDGVTIDASVAGLEEPVEVFIERLEPSEVNALPPLSTVSNLQAVTAYYRISVKGDYRVRAEDWFRISLPLPDGIEADGLGVFSYFRPGEALGLGPDEDGWMSSPTRFDASAGEVVFASLQLRPEGLLFVIVDGAYSRGSF